MKFRLTNYLTTNILSILGWLTGMTTLMWLFFDTNNESYMFYFGLHIYIGIVALVFTILFPLEIYLSKKYNKYILGFMIKNLALKIIYNLVFYIGIIELYREYFDTLRVLWSIDD